MSYIGDPVATGGMAFDGQGRIVAASVGALHGRDGPLRRIDPATGAVEILVAELEGRKLVASNCPVVARDGTIYCSHSGWTVGNIGTRQAEGFIFAVSLDGSARVVARGLRGVNGLCLGSNDDQLLAALTAEGRIVTWERAADGGLSNKRYASPELGKVVADQKAAEIRAMSARQRGLTGYCDGLVMNRDGSLFVTLPFANRIVSVDRMGRLSTLIHDPTGARINFPTNLAWGGPDLRDLFVVSRGSGSIARARMKVPGIPAANWPL
ncbi:MAG: SMP-30/gluconolactonase/LRE family protein [Novosphingobium sp.]|nr:SMP-30/gluconolactonase/LRE family protein [Novosphingobium sp.]